MTPSKKKDEQVRELRRRGLELVSKDQFDKAVKIYEKLVTIDPEDGDWARRAAECHFKLKDDHARLKYSIMAAEAFCDSGFLLKAIAMCKVVLNLDPNHHGTQRRLARLYAKRPGNEEPSAHSGRAIEQVGPDPQAADSTRVSAAKAADPRRQRARQAAAAALRLIRAQRRAQQEESHREENVDANNEARSSEPTSAPVKSPATFEPRPTSKPRPAVDLPPPVEPGVPSVQRVQGAQPPSSPNRSLSLQEISLRARLPSIPRSLTPESAQPAYSLMPPPDLMNPENSLALSQGAEEASRFSESMTRMQMLEPQALSREAPEAIQAMAIDPAMRLSLAPITFKPPAMESVLEGSAAEALEFADDQPSSSFEDEPSSENEATVTVLQQFERIPLFSALSDDSLILFINGLELVELVKGEVLFDIGDLADSMYVITEGSVAAEVDRGDGASLILAELGEGEFFGEIGLLSNQPRQARVRASKNCHLLRIEREVVTRLMEIDQTFLSTLIEFLRERLVDGLIQTSPLFDGLAFDERLALAQQFEFLEVEEDTALLEPGVRPAGMYVLLAGAALAYRPKSRPQLVHLRPGAIFGEAPLLNQTVSEEEVRTTSKSFALCLSEGRFRELIMTHPTVLEYVASLQTETSDHPVLGDHVTLY